MAAQAGDSFTHTQHAEAGILLPVLAQAPAIVFDGQVQQAVRIGAQFHGGLVGARVACHIRQAFLHQAVDGRGDAVV